MLSQDKFFGNIMLGLWLTGDAEKTMPAG